MDCAIIVPEDAIEASLVEQLAKYTQLAMLTKRALQELRNSKSLVVTVRTDTSVQKNTKNAGFAPIEALLIMLVLATIALGCSPCKIKKTLEQIEKIATPLIGDKLQQKVKTNGKKIQTQPKKIQKEIQQRHKSTCEKRKTNANARRMETLMQCYHPRIAYYSKKINETGKRSLVFHQKQAYEPDNPIDISCGQCRGCKLKRSVDWAVRCMHETTLHKNNSFLTLTISDEGFQKREDDYIAKNLKRQKQNKEPIDVPSKHSLDTRDYQLFMKRLKKYYKGKKIRFFQCGEYGDQNFRPHYHSILFGHAFDDMEFKRWNNTGEYKMYESKILNKLWGYGECYIGSVTFESCAYIARYIMKKVTGEQAEGFYQHYDQDTGEISKIKPEYNTMSRRPGIAKDWFDKYYLDLYPSDNITIDKKKRPIPKYYDSLMEFIDQETLEIVKEKRLLNIKPQDNTVARLETKEEVLRLRAKQLIRTHDHGKG